ncbi:MAG: type I-F CRISPR-associated endoribonuclease Cas6/Csy4 [Marinomonas sp.]
MKHYLDITLLPDAEMSLGFVWYKLYQQIHLMLVENKVGEKDSAIAVSFPHYAKKGFPLGDKLRLLAGTQQDLERLDVGRWLSRLEDYLHIKSIKPVPDAVTEFVYFKRWVYKSPDKMRSQVNKRAEYLAKKNGLNTEQVKARLLESIDNMEQQSRLPFLNMSSLSTDSNVPASERRNFKLFIEKQQVESLGNNQKLFTCYGLSRRSEEQQAPIPWFD